MESNVRPTQLSSLALLCKIHNTWGGNTGIFLQCFYLHEVSFLQVSARGFKLGTTHILNTSYTKMKTSASQMRILMANLTPPGPPLSGFRSSAVSTNMSYREAALPCNHKTDTSSPPHLVIGGSLAVKETGWPQFKSIQIRV